MRITKNKLKQIIKEELAGYMAEQSVLAERKAKKVKGRVSKFKKAMADIQNPEVWKVPEEDLTSHPAAAWYDMWSQVSMHWHRVFSQFHGCNSPTNEGNPECLKWATIKADMADIEAAHGDMGEADSLMKVLVKNYRTIMKSFSYIPPDNKHESILEMPVYIKAKATAPDPISP